MGYTSPKTYSISGFHSSVQNPVDATTYYIGGAAPAMDTGDVVRMMSIPISGFVRQIMLRIRSGTTAGTNEGWTVSLTDGTTTTAIGTVSASAAVREWSNNNLNFKVTKGGYIQFVTVTPTWVTNPEGCTCFYTIVIEYE